MFGIIQDARKGEGIKTLALVDRKRSNRHWWTSDDANIAICYEKKDAAEYAARRLQRNNARVVPFVLVQQILSAQRDNRLRLELSWLDDDVRNESELGWDAHKGVF